MIVYIENLVKAYNMLKQYVKKHSDDEELKGIFAAFGNAFAYTVDGVNKIR